MRQEFLDRFPSVGNLSRSSSLLHAADNPSRSSGSLLRCITSKSARNTSLKKCSVKLWPVFSPAPVTAFGNCLASFPPAPYTRQVSYNPFAFRAGALCREVLLPRLRNGFIFFQLLDLLLSLSNHCCFFQRCLSHLRSFRSEEIMISSSHLFFGLSTAL